jgi:hypothetical protein
MRKEKIRRFGIGTPLVAPWFRLTREAHLDRFFKAIGMAREAETGDREFDRLVYVAGDHPAVHQLLRQSAPARAAIRAVLAAGFVRISSNGACLTLEHPEARGPTADELKLLVPLRAALVKWEGPGSSRFLDRFQWKVVAVEAAVWSIVAYAAGSVIDRLFNREDYHVQLMPLVQRGLIAALLLFLFLFTAIAMFLRRSSRGHRILVESALLLALGLPVAGVQVVSDLNRALDGGDEVVVTRRIEDVEKETGRRRPTSYYLHLTSGPPEPIDLPPTIQVEEAVFSQAWPGAVAAFHVGPGWLGVPWYRRIEILHPQ